MLHPLGDLAQGRGARVVGPVDAVAEAHQPLAAVEGVAQPLLGMLDEPILASWSTTSDGAPPWSGPFIVPIAPHDRRRDVRHRRGDHAGGERRGVEAVLGADDEVGVEGAGGRRLRRLAPLSW